MYAYMVTPTVKASIVATTMDLNGHPVRLITTLTRAISEVAVIKAAGIINQGTSSINIRIVLILITPLKLSLENY